MAQITWRNIDAPDLTRSLYPLLGAQQSLNTGLGTLDAMLAERQAVNSAGIERGLTAQRENFLTRLSQVRDPQAMQQMVATGEFDAQLGQLDPRVQSQVRGAGAERLNSLFGAARTQNEALAAQRSAETAGYNHEQTLQDRALLPAMTAVRSAMANNDFASARQLMGQTNFGRHTPTLLGELEAAEREEQTYGNKQIDRQDTLATRARENELANLQLDTARRGAAEVQARDALSAEAAKYAEERRAQAAEQARLAQGNPEIKFTADGFVDLTTTQSTKAGRNALEALEKANPQLRPQTDTARVDQALARLREQGIAPGIVESQRGYANETFSSVFKPIGAEAERIRVAKENADTQDALDKQLAGSFIDNEVVGDKWVEVEKAMKDVGISEKSLDDAQNVLEQLQRRPAPDGQDSPDPIHLPTFYRAVLNAERSGWFGVVTWEKAIKENYESLMKLQSTKDQLQRYKNTKFQAKLTKKEAEAREQNRIGPR